MDQTDNQRALRCQLAGMAARVEALEVTVTDWMNAQKAVSFEAQFIRIRRDLEALQLLLPAREEEQPPARELAGKCPPIIA